MVHLSDLQEPVFPTKSCAKSVGKTESVKALGGQLGRFVLVFCCDDTFDFKAMARIFLGICQVGAWGCFDEFNRLEERILSAVSQQIQTIQLGLQSLSDTGKAIIDLTGRSFELHKDTGKPPSPPFLQ